MNTNNFMALLLFLVNNCLVAQQEEKVVKDSIQSVELKEVIIHGTRTLRQLSSLPLPVQIIRQKEIREINSVRLTDILNEQTGLITVSDFRGSPGIQLQGLHSQYTLILLDGVPLIGRFAGTLDTNRMSVGNIKKIEVVKGASSSLYGSGALAGVINIITEIPENGFEGNINYRGQTFNTHDISANINYKKNKLLGFNAFLNRYSSDGYDLIGGDALNTVEPFSDYTFNTKFTLDFTKNTSLLLSGRYCSTSQNSIAEDNRGKLARGKSEKNEWNAHVKLNHTYNSKWSSYLRFYATQYKTDEYLNYDNDKNFSQSYFDLLFVCPETRVTFTPYKKHSFIGGIGLTYERLNRSYFSITPEFNAFYAYVQYDASPLEKLNVIFGGRFDKHSEYESQLSPKAALHYDLSEKIAIKASLGYGFKAPDFRQLYLNYTNPILLYTVLGSSVVKTVIAQLQEDGQLLSISKFDDSRLRPESSISYNLGFDFKPLSTLKFNVNLFRNDIKNLIDTRRIAKKKGGGIVITYYNADKVRTQGLEFNASWKFNENLSFSGGCQFLFAKDKEEENRFERGEVFARLTPNSSSFQLKKEHYFGLFNRSRYMANFKLFYTIPQWNMNANFRGKYRSKYGAYDTNGNNLLDDFDKFVDAHFIWDLAINKTFYERYQLGLGSDNIFDFKNPNIPQIAGRIIYGKLNIQF